MLSPTVLGSITKAEEAPPKRRPAPTHLEGAKARGRVALTMEIALSTYSPCPASRDAYLKGNLPLIIIHAIPVSWFCVSLFVPAASLSDEVLDEAYYPILVLRSTGES